MKTKLIFDYDSSKRLQYYLYAKGEIKPSEQIDDMKVVNFFGYDHYNVSLDYLRQNELERIRDRYDIDTMLTSLCMFDEIRITPCNGDAYLNLDGENLDGDGKLQDIGVSYVSKYKKPKDEVIRNTIEILKAHRSNIIDAINHDDCFMNLRYVAEECEVFEVYIDNKMYIDALDRYRKHPVKDFFDRFNPIAGLNDLSRMRDLWDVERYTYENYLDECFLHIYDVMSTDKGYALSSCFRFPSQDESAHINECRENHEQINHMVELNFNEDILWVPQPQTIKEVEELRTNPDWVSFRDVYAQWIDCLQDGDIDSFAKMKDDVIKAQQALEKLNK